MNDLYPYENTPTVEYKIQKGDTLWGISHKFTNKNLIVCGLPRFDNLINLKNNEYKIITIFEIFLYDST